MSASAAPFAVAQLARTIADIRLPHPVRVRVDGRTGSGKSTLANSLAAAVAATGRHTIRASIDDFHRPAAERRKRGRYSATGYYCDARDLDALVTLLLEPLGPGGSLRFARRSFDLLQDTSVEPQFESASADSVVIIDGTFLQRPELRHHFEFRIFLDVPEPVARARAIARDAAIVGSAEEAEKLYDCRYAPAFRLYEQSSSPIDSADIVVR